MDSVNIPKTVTTVDPLTFVNSTLQSVTVSEDNPEYSSYERMLFSKDKKTLLMVPA